MAPWRLSLSLLVGACSTAEPVAVDAAAAPAAVDSHSPAVGSGPSAVEDEDPAAGPRPSAVDPAAASGGSFNLPKLAGVPAVGTGLNGVSYFGPFCPFADVVKCMRWNNVKEWDARGFPTQANRSKKVSGLAGVDNAKAWAEGEYTLTWEGRGDVKLTRNATLVREKLDGPVKKRVYSLSMKDARRAVWLEIDAFPATNIRVWHPGLENHGSAWNPEYVKALTPFRGKVLRFMDLNQTNNSEQKDWSDRTPGDWSSYVMPSNSSSPWKVNGAVPYERMVELANQLQTHVWVNIPHLATDDYVRKMAQLIKKDLRPDRKVIVEYSNELWNWSFAQAHWVKENIDGNNQFARIGQVSARKINVFRDAFGDEGRVVRVLGTQTGFGNAKSTSLMLDAVNRDDFDAVAITTYFSHGIEGYIYENWSEVKDDPDRVIAELRNRVGTGPFSKDDYYDREYHQYRVAAERQVPLIAYEGNSHVVASRRMKDANGKPIGKLFDLIPETVDYLHQLERRQDFVEIYRAHLNRHLSSGLSSNTIFVATGSWSKWGQWGHQEYLGQPLEQAKKYRMILDLFGLEAPK